MPQNNPSPAEELRNILNTILRHHDHPEHAQDLDVQSIVAYFATTLEDLQLPEKYKHRHKHDVQTKDGVYLCLACHKSAEAIMSNDGEGWCPHYKSYNKAIDESQAAIDQLIAELRGKL